MGPGDNSPKALLWELDISTRRTGLGRKAKLPQASKRTGTIRPLGGPNPPDSADKVS